MRSILDLFSFFSNSGEYTAEQGPVRSPDHRRIVLLAWTLGVIGFLIGGVIVVTMLATGDMQKEISNLRPGRKAKGTIAIFLVPFMLGAMGALLGVAVGCSSASTPFLQSEKASKWLDLVGTRDIGVARAVCWTCVLLLGGLMLVAAFMGYKIVTDS